MSIEKPTGKPAVRQRFNAGLLRELAEGEPAIRRFAQHDVLLYRLGDQVFAVQAFCPHAGRSLATAVVEGHCLRCPFHGAEFDIQTGAVLSSPARAPLATYPVDIIDQTIFVTL